jgi:predicted ATPase
MMSKITTDHLSRAAYVYVRQSTPGQLINNPESRRRQYALVERAKVLGWENVIVVDEDLGHSGDGTARSGFDCLLTAVCTGTAGVVFAIECSRFARNGREWHTLLEFCALVNCLIVDEDDVERAAGLAHSDTVQAKLDKLDAVLAQASTSIQDAALFAEMLSLPNDGRYPALDLAPQERRRRTLEALRSQLEALARQNPVLMVFEDAHWIDPTSLEAFGRVVDGIRMHRVLLIVTFRAEFDPPWVGQPHVTTITINRLTQRQVDALIERSVA